MGNDKWDKVIKHLRSSNRDPDKVLKLLKGSDKGIETSYSISRSSYALNVIALITQKIMDPKNKGKTRSHIIRTWVKSKEFEDFYNLMRLNEKKKYNKANIETYVKQLNDLWAKPSQRANREYFRKTKGRVLIKPTTAFILAAGVGFSSLNLGFCPGGFDGGFSGQ